MLLDGSRREIRHQVSRDLRLSQPLLKIMKAALADCAEEKPLLINGSEGSAWSRCWRKVGRAIHVVERQREDV
jgi:hypothetical protein